MSDVKDSREGAPSIIQYAQLTCATSQSNLSVREDAPNIWITMSLTLMKPNACPMLITVIESK